MIPLRFANQGEVHVIQRVGGRPELRKHLENLGFVPGSRVTVVSSIRGDLIVAVKESRVAIDQNISLAATLLLLAWGVFALAV